MIVYYITSHGFGHAVRSCEVIRNIDPALPLTVRSNVPEWFLRQEIGTARPYILAPAEFDCGVLGPDSSRCDLAATVTRMEELFQENEARLEAEVAYLKAVGARAVVCDVPPFPLRVARAAGVPSILIANFTWSAIYQHLADHFSPGPEVTRRAQAVIDRMQAEYDQGDLLLATDMAIKMRACARRVDVPMVARHGASRREKIARELGLDPARPIYLLYLGRDGMNGIRWERLKELNLQVISYLVPPGAEGLVVGIPEELIDHVDAASSVDTVIAKPGYGICGESIAAGTPLIFTPREEFAEMAGVYPLMARWGGGVEIAEQDFCELNWQPYIERARSVKINHGAVDCSGGAACARWIERAWAGELGE